MVIYPCQSINIGNPYRQQEVSNDKSNQDQRKNRLIIGLLATSKG